MNSKTNSAKTTLQFRLRIAPAAETAVRSGHPWIFADRIREQNRDGVAGELAVIYDRNDRFLAAGLFDPDSPIRVRVLHTGKPRTIDRDWWVERLTQAVERRRGLFDDQTKGYRLINGESDGWPGLVLDRYAAVLVVKVYTAAWLPRLKEIIELFRERLVPERIVLRLSRKIVEAARESFGFNDGQLLYGDTLEACPTFLESGLRFEADVQHGQKTGFFLDQRENRRIVESFAGGRSVLNASVFPAAFRYMRRAAAPVRWPISMWIVTRCNLRGGIRSERCASGRGAVSS